MLRVLRSILGELKSQRKPGDLSTEGYPLAWRIGDVVTAPAGATALTTLKAVSAYKVAIHGYVIAAEESNTFEINFTSSQGAKTILVPTTSAGIIVVISEDVPLNLDNLSVGDITIENQAAGNAGKEYQASLLYKVVR
jgi:hypothetical protein